MILDLYDLLGITGVSGLFGGLTVLLVDHFFIKSRELEARQWEIKRDVCLNALDIIDSMFANKYPSADYQKLVSIEEIRSAHNRLMLSCKHKDAVAAFEKCLGLGVSGEYSTSDIIPLRNMLRKELGFNKIEMDPVKTWIQSNGLSDRKISR